MADQRSIFVPVDLDTGGGTENVLMISSRGEASGGSLPVYSPPAALVDNTTNPTVGGVQTFLMNFDGSTWDRVLGDSTDGLLINLGTNNDVINLGTFVVQEDGAALTALELIDNPVQVFGTDTYLEATDSGMMIGVVRNDVLATLASVDNEIAPLQVDATGALYTRIASSVALDVSAATVTVDTELPTAATLGDDTTNPSVPGVGSFGHVWDGSTWDRQLGDQTDGTLVNLGTNNDVTTELPAAAAMTTDSIANPTSPSVTSHLVGYDRVNDDWTRIAGLVDGEAVGALNAGFLQFGSDGSNYQAITTDASGHLQVDVLSGGGSPPAPTTPVNDTQTTATVDVGDANKVNVDSADVEDRKLAWIDIWSSVNWKGEIFTVDNGSPSTRKGMTGGPAMTAVQYIPVHEDFIQTGSTAGVDSFRLVFTNLDDNLIADVHVVFHYND